MNKTVKDAMAKGKALRAELDTKAEIESQKRAKAKEEESLKKKAELKAEAEHCLEKIPEGLANAVAHRKTSFIIMTYDDDCREKYEGLSAIIEPKLKKMGLNWKHTSSVHYVPLSFDPDTGYDATYYHLEVIVPNEEL